MAFFWKMVFRLCGWTIRDAFPPGIDKAVIIVAPHTSAWDFPICLAIRSILQLKHAYYLGKEELFNGPFGFLFKATGGYPVNRFNKEKMVDQVVELFDSHPKFMIGISPEGTRKRAERLRTGFYFIAKKAKVPIVMVGLDYANKEVCISLPIFTSDDEVADFNRIIHFFGPIQGKNPASGLSHLMNNL